MSSGLEPVTGASLARAPAVCHDCVFWQSHSYKRPPKERWMRHIEDDWGSWGTLYHDADGRLLGFLQFGPTGHFPRARSLPAGPPSADALLVTCAYVVDESTPWVLQSLFLSVIGEARDRRIRAIETFTYGQSDAIPPRGEFRPHRTIFPAAFVADLGFMPVRTQGRIALARLEISTLSPLVTESWRRKLARRLRERGNPAPVPQRP